MFSQKKRWGHDRNGERARTNCARQCQPYSILGSGVACISWEGDGKSIRPKQFSVNTPGERIEPEIFGDNPAHFNVIVIRLLIQ